MSCRVVVTAEEFDLVGDNGIFSGNSNYTGILSKDNLRKAYNEWLLPLRTLLTGTMAESQNNDDPFSSDTVCSLNPVEFVLFRCIELVEEKLKHL